MRRCITTATATAGALLALTGNAIAAPGRTSPTLQQTRALAAIEQFAQALAPPTGWPQVEEQAAALQPQVDQLVAEAQASGDGGAIQALIGRTDLPGSPAVHLAILRDTQQYDVTAPATTIPSPSPSPSPSARAAANRCWGADDSVYTRHYWGGLWTAAWVSIVSEGWCGNGTKITWFPGFWGRSYPAPGYCFTSESLNNGSWISYWGWVHGGHWANVGLNVPAIGCQTLPGSGGGATLREAANGYWDKRY